MKSEINFIGIVKWRYRWQYVISALKVLYMAVKGYHQTIVTLNKDENLISCSALYDPPYPGYRTKQS